MAAYQAPLSLGFSRQEQWSGLPFPSPMHESEKGKGSCSVVSDSSRPHGLQPTRLLRPWGFPGKSTGVECHRLLQLCAKLLQLCPTLCDPMDCSPGLLCPWDSPGKNTGVGCHALLQRIFPTSPASLALAARFFTTSTTWEAISIIPKVVVTESMFLTFIFPFFL